MNNCINCILFILVTSNIVWSQTARFESDSSIKVFTYGLEDVTTINLIETLVSKNYIVFVEDWNTYDIRSSLEFKMDLWADEELICTELLDSFSSKASSVNRIFGYFNTTRITFPDEYFKQKDKKIYDSLKFIFKVKDDFAEHFSSNIEAFRKTKIITSFASSYFLNGLDSLIIANSAEGIMPIDLFSLLNERGKKVAVVCNYQMNPKLNESLMRNVENSYALLPKVGSNKRGTKLLRFRNRLKEQGEYTEIEPENLPRKVRFTRKSKVKTKDLRGVKFLYVDELDNCFW